MPTEAKMAAVAELKEELSNSKAAIVADYRGLTVSDISAIRRSLRGEGITYKVVKNRLAKIAATQAGRGELNELLDGPTALAMGPSDEVTLARVFLDAVRPYKTVAIRGGIVGQTLIDAGSISRMASLPSREILLAQLAGGIASPLATMASLLAAPLRNLGYAFSQLIDMKGKQAGTPAKETAQAEAAAEAPRAEAAAEVPQAEAAAEAPQAEAAAEGEAEAPQAEAAAEAPAAEEPEPETPAAETTEAEADDASAATTDDSETQTA